MFKDLNIVQILFKLMKNVLATCIIYFITNQTKLSEIGFISVLNLQF